MKHLLMAFFLVLSFSQSHSQVQLCAVYLTDKEGQTLNPFEYFHPAAIERRINNNLPLVSKTDLPVREDYIQAISQKADSVAVVSRWFNMMAVWIDNAAVREIEAFPFVKKVEILVQNQENKPLLSIDNQCLELNDEGGKELSNNQLALLKFQTDRMKRMVYEQKNIRGKGVRIAVFDAGFSFANQHDALNHLNIEMSYDFIKKSDFVFDYSTHGTGVLSCIGGKYKDIPMGMATESTFLLARTERAFTEFRKEEVFWLAAAEWADKNGAHLINSSLGYTQARYFIEDMDGKTSLASRAATMAFRKGIVVVNAAGNSGNENWKYIGTPADADSVIAVGGIDPQTDARISFSSYGPSATGRLKPEVSAMGKAVVAGNNNKYNVSFGTSFASPLVCGFVACFMQLHPDMGNRDVYEYVQEASNLYPYFDYSHGYGIPQADKGKALPSLIPRIAVLPTFKWVIEESILYIELTETFFQWTKNLDFLPKMNIYTHAQGREGVLTEYQLLRISFDDLEDIIKNKTYKMPVFRLKDYEAGTELRVHFEGFTASYTVN